MRDYGIDALVECDWCKRRTARHYDLTINSEAVCKSCRPYAGAAMVYPRYRAENMAIARKRADQSAIERADQSAIEQGGVSGH